MSFTDLSIPTLPTGLHASRLGTDSRRSRVRRNEVLAFWAEGLNKWILYRVAKAANDNPPRWYLVNLEVDPYEGTLGVSSTHFPREAHYHLVEAYSRSQLKYWRVDQALSAEFLAFYVAKARANTAARKDALQDWETGPGGVAERLVRRATKLRSDASHLRGRAIGLDTMADELEGEADMLRKIGGEKP